MKKLKTKSLYNTLIIILTITAILRIFYYNNKEFKSNLNINDTQFIGNITKLDKDKITIKINNEYLIDNYQESDNLKLNDKIKITGTLSIPKENTIFNSFNYKEYLYHNKIYFIIDINDIELIEKNTNVLYKLKNYIIERISNYKSYPYMNAFILGNTNDIDLDVKESYQINNISHLFAVSGMHIGLFTNIINKFTNKITKRKNIAFLILVSFLFFYSFLVNYSPSVLRASLFLIFNQINMKFKINIKAPTLIYFIMLILLIINPFYLYHLGFIYSFTISFSLITLNTYLNKSKNYLITLLKISVISFISSSIITIYNNYELNMLGILYNLFFVPFISFIVFPLSLINILVNIDFIYVKLINILESISLFLSNINILKFTMKKPTILVLVVMTLLIIFILYKIKRTNKNRWIVIFFILILIYSNYNYFIKENYLTIIDVGQGDCTLIHLNNKSILIDTGGSFYTDYSEKTINYLKSMGISKIDYLILTHGDFDHMGEGKDLIENFKVDEVIFNCGDYNYLEKELIKVLDKKNIKHYSCVKELNVDKHKLQFLNTKKYDNENDNSNVIYFNYNNYKFLFMGDAGIEKEKDILAKYNLADIDFLKVGHHGSNTSCSKEFINSINPKYSLISVGKNNRYGHPKENVLDTLSNSKIYRTDIDGSIKIKINKNGYKISTCIP